MKSTLTNTPDTRPYYLIYDKQGPIVVRDWFKVNPLIREGVGRYYQRAANVQERDRILKEMVDFASGIRPTYTHSIKATTAHRTHDPDEMRLWDMFDDDAAVRMVDIPDSPTKPVTRRHIDKGERADQKTSTLDKEASGDGQIIPVHPDEDFPSLPSKPTVLSHNSPKSKSKSKSDNLSIPHSNPAVASSTTLSKLFPSPQSTEEQEPATPIVFSNIRTLDGTIIGTVSEDDQIEDVPVPSLGLPADLFLKTHGFTIPSILIILSSYQESTDEEDFIGKLAIKGMAATESAYLWMLIVQGKDLDQGSGRWTMSTVLGGRGFRYMYEFKLKGFQPAIDLENDGQRFST